MQDDHFINYPIFLKYKRRFDWRSLRRRPFIKKAVLNERIIEIPFAIDSLAGLAKTSRILDLGCMESALPLFMASLGLQVTGFDFRKYPYRAPNFTFVQGDILRLPFDDGSFDAVTCISTIEHIGIGFYDDPKDSLSPDIKGMSEARRVLKQGGLLVLTVPFGKAHVNGQQRIYDKGGLSRLLEGFHVNKMKFFKNVAVPHGNNYWIEISQEDAGLIDYAVGTECVSCVCASNGG